MENTLVENILDNPGSQKYAPCGCSENVFQFKQGLYGKTYEVRYWLATSPEHNHRMDKPRIKITA